MGETLFGRIARREIAADIVHETEDVIAFRDISPQAPEHILIVPKKTIPRIAAAQDEDALLLGKLLLAARDVAAKEGLCEGGFRIVINNGRDGGETVPHLHVHLLGGRQLAWPPG